MGSGGLKVARRWVDIPDHQVRTLNLDPATVVSTVLGAIPKIQALRSDIVKHTPTYDITELDLLGPCALAFQDAQVRYLSGTRSPDALQALGAEGKKTCDRFRADSMALTAHQLIEEKSLEQCRGLPGYKNIANELGVFVAVLRPALPRIQGRCAITPEDLDRAEQISGALLRYVGLRDDNPAAMEALANERDRAFTLLNNLCEQARRVVLYLRFNVGDGDNIAPSLYAGRRNRRTRSATKGASSRPPANTGAPVPASVQPPTPPGAPAEAYGAPGIPNSNPFAS
jgi:hypothetical protein